jgi:hypothetical protein
MGILITCIGPDGQPMTINANGVGVSGGSVPTNPTFGAERLNLSFAEVQRTIAEGEAKGIRPFSIEGPGSGVGQGLLAKRPRHILDYDGTD